MGVAPVQNGHLLRKPENGDYYRPRFRHVEDRRDMLSLPVSLRGSTHFGDDILDGSELSDALLDVGHRFVAPAGTVVMFDGSRGIHRGGAAVLTAAAQGRVRELLRLGVQDEADPAQPHELGSDVQAGEAGAR